MPENERIKAIRKALNLTQDDFGAAIGLKRSAISLIEGGTNAVTNQVRTAICREFGVREAWLRDGSGEMFREQSRDEQIDRFFHDVSFGEDGFKRQFCAMLARLTEEEWSLLERRARELAESMEKADL